MRFRPLEVPGAYLIEPEEHRDERGSFARLHCEEELARLGLSARFPQCSRSHNLRRGTLRGLHFQRGEHAEDKLVWCAAGAIYDVILDLRADSPACGRWVAVELSRANRRQVYIPRGCAHGFLTLSDDVDVLYLISAPYAPQAAGGVRWDDPGFAIEWPEPPTVISARDQAWPDYPS